VFDLSSEVLDKVTDGRQQPRTPTAPILKSASRTSNPSAASVAVEAAHGGTLRIFVLGRR
jgi:hypothetical protein